jgi:hypothetical protein
LGATPPSNGTPRHPRGSSVGGRFAEKKIISEPDVDLEGVELAELDGSRGAEEMARKRDEAIAAARLESDRDASDPVDTADTDDTASPETPSSEFVLSDDMIVLAAMEAEMLGPISDEHFFEDDVDKPHKPRNPKQKPSIQLGGKISFSDTWNFPPSSRVGVEVLADFFARVEIFDGAVSNIENADRWGRDITRYEQEYKTWFDSARAITKRFQRNNPEEAEQLSSEYKARIEFLNQVRHGAGLIPTSEYRDVARLYGFFLQTRGLPEDEAQQAATREFIDSGGSVVTPLDVTMKYRLWEISGAWFGRQKYPRYD